MKTARFPLVLAGITATVICVVTLLGGHSSYADQPAPAPSPYVVTIKNFAFSPASLTVPLGATVVWKNDDGVAHTATSTSRGFDSGNLDDGAHFSFTFQKAGTYAYVCSYHPNMTGQIMVVAPSPAPTH
ncbi:MAG: cupredoxin family copper-binding protein [Candidatus Eremiobacteraeota bacterium]|nr:cupredoxin family copper-binding protein [Candidatus Eremiobacteraeota bacterium]